MTGTRTVSACISGRVHITRNARCPARPTRVVAHTPSGARWVRVGLSPRVSDEFKIGPAFIGNTGTGAIRYVVNRACCYWHTKWRIDLNVSTNCRTTGVALNGGHEKYGVPWSRTGVRTHIVGYTGSHARRANVRKRTFKNPSKRPC